MTAQSPPESWSEGPLLRKARVYVARAAGAENSAGLDQLWSLLGLELLARAAVARVHPALLAEPGEGPFLLYAFGYGEPKRPRSVAIATVFRRCQAIIPEFTETLTSQGIGLMALRNEELHSGDLVLEALKSSAWQPQYYTICEVLLSHLGLGLDDFFPTERAASARTMLDSLSSDVESEVKQRIADQRHAFDARSDEDRNRRSAQQQKQPAGTWFPHARQIVVLCPACQSRALVGGETASVSEARVGDGEIERDIRILPTSFACEVCELPLAGHAELRHAGLGDEFSVRLKEDPLDYYGINPMDYVSVEDFIEPDYGND